MAPQHHRVVPKVESLESRWVPAVTTHLSARGILTVTGDVAPDSIVIIDNGTNVNGNISLRVNGQLQTFPTRTVATVRVLAGGGNDVVAYRLTGDLQAGPRPRNIIVNLGEGNNTFIGTAIGDVKAGATLGVFAFGGTGRDFLSWNAAIDVEAGGALQVQTFGLGGIDSLVTTHTGRINGNVNYQLNGGPGIDSVQATINPLIGSTGQLTANVRGQGDDDFLTLYVFSSLGLNVNAGVDGGAGFNTALTTTNVARVNVQGGSII